MNDTISKAPYRRVLDARYLADQNLFPGLHALQLANARRLREKVAVANTHQSSRFPNQ